jgi:DNA-directed RNA polymerase specialized sigma24 family protein
MQLPSSIKISESEVLAIIDEVVKVLAPSFKFGYYDIDDLEQEGRILAIDALSRYKSDKGASLKTFLYNHVKKRFINLKRDKHFRPAPKNISEEKLQVWLKKNSCRRSLIDTVDISDNKNNPTVEQDQVENIHLKEISSIIDLHLPVEFRADYRCILEDVRIPKSRRIKVLCILKDILNEHLFGKREREETW